MVTRFFQAANSSTSARSVSIQTKLWRTSWACLLAISCGTLTGCQSSRLGSRDSLASLQSEDADKEIETRSSKTGFGSFFTRWWPSEPKDDAYDLGLPRVEEDYVMNDSEFDSESRGEPNAKAQFSDKPGTNKMAQGKASANKSAPTNPAEKRKNQLAKNSAADPLETDGLDAEQRDLYRRQMEAMRRLGIDKDDMADILADDATNAAFDPIVQLPPPTQASAAPGSNAPANHEALAGNAGPGNAGSINNGARLKFSDDAPPPAPPIPQFNQAAANQAPVMAAAPLAVPQLPTTQQPITQQPATPHSPATPQPVGSQFASTPLPANASLPAAPQLQPMEVQSPVATNSVQSASGVNTPNDRSAIVTGPYIQTNSSTSPVVPWENDVRQAVIKLQERLAQDKNLTAKERTNLEARLRLMQLAANDMDGAMNPSQSWNKDADQWFRSTLFSIHEATALTGPESPNQRFTLVAKHQQEGAQHLLALSDLEVNNVAFCTEVQSYGQVVKRPANALVANEEVILYCEFNNFAALKVRDGYETEFEARYEIVDLQNNRIYEEKLPTDRQTSANRRRDYFIAYQMYLPKDIAPGHYRLKLNVKDVKAGKFGQGLVEFQIVKK